MIISAFLAGELFIYISEQVVEEVQQNIASKFPLLRTGFSNFLLAQPKIIGQPSIKEIREAYNLINTEDAPILAAAIKGRPDFLITWDIKHFLKREVMRKVSFVICTPKEFLQRYWRMR